MPLGRLALGGGGEWVGLLLSTAAMIAVRMCSGVGNGDGR